MLLVTRTAALGALMTIGVMAGAIGSHVFVLGLEVKDDGGLLFALALIALACGAAVAWIRRADLPIVGACFACPSQSGTKS